MTKQYEPELGQLFWGQPPQPYDCPDWAEPVLTLIALAVELKSGEPFYQSPFNNTGVKFKNDTFEVQAYDWSYMGYADMDKAPVQPYNFKWRDVEISWYKYMGRGMSINREVMFAEGLQMLHECIVSLGI